MKRHIDFTNHSELVLKWDEHLEFFKPDHPKNFLNLKPITYEIEGGIFMERIVFLQSMNQTKTIFSEAQMNRIKQLGDVVINDEKGKVTEDSIKKLLADADVAITSWGCPTIDENLLASAPDLKVVLHAAGSVKKIVSPELWRKGIRVSSSADALGKGVAETALGLMIISLKKIPYLAEDTKAGKWGERKNLVREIYGLTVGVIGAGRAGRHFIRLLSNFDVDVMIYDPMITDLEAKELGGTKVELEELLSLSDVVSIHAPSIPATNKMINESRLALMKDDAILINTARGTIIDEAALVEQLQKGRLFACLDVTDPEPPAIDYPFRSLPNVLLTPHIAGAVNNGKQRLGAYVTEELKLYQAGEKMRGEVDQSSLAGLA